MMACIAFEEEDVPGAICSVVGAAESHLAIAFRLHTNEAERGMPKAKAGNCRATCEQNSLLPAGRGMGVCVQRQTL